MFQNGRIFIVLFIFLFTISCSCNKKNIKYCDDTKMEKCFEYYTDFLGRINGTFIEFKDGYTFRKISYKRGKIDGRYTEYYSKDSVKFTVEYKDNKLWNVIEYNDINGNILNFGNFKDGNGEIITYSPEGKIRKKGKFLNGLKIGNWDFYSNKGYGFSKEYTDGKVNGTGEIDYLPPF